VLTNAVLLAIVIPGWLALDNLLGGRLRPKAMVLARPVAIDSLPDRHGRLFETVEGLTTDGRSDIDDDLDWGDASATPDGGEAVAPADVDDPWGVDRFFEEIDRSTYGVDADQLRDGLELLARTEDDTVWVSPGLPFVVPMFLGLLVAFTYGDLLFALLGWLGIPIV
jgi:preflagellin peptidase FlaK